MAKFLARALKLADKSPVSVFLDNAQHILDVAAAGEPSGDFALLIRPDGGLHFIMESPVSLEAASAHAGAETAYYVTRSRAGVRVEGRNFGQRCLLESRIGCPGLLRDQPLYLTGSSAS